MNNINKIPPARILLGAAVVLILIFLILPVLVIVPMSFSDTRFMTFPPPSYSLRWYHAFFSNPVWMPQIKSSVIAGAIFAFIQALDETIVALFISGGQYQTLTKRMFTTLRDEIDPTIAAISTLLTVASVALILLMVFSRRMAQR